LMNGEEGDVIIDILLALVLHGYCVTRARLPKVRSDVERTIARWKELGSVCGWIRVAKWKLAAFASWQLNNIVPAKPFDMTDLPHILMCGSTGRWLMSEVRRCDVEKQFSLLATINIGVKKGSPRPTKEMVETALEKTFHALTDDNKHPTEVKPPMGIDIDEIFEDWHSKTPPLVLPKEQEPRYVPTNTKRCTMRRKWKNEKERELHAQYHAPGAMSFGMPWEELLTPQVVEREIYRTVSEVLGRIPLGEEIEPYFPSTSANYISSRSDLGSVGAILGEYSDVLDGLRTPGGPTEGKEHLELKSQGEVTIYGEAKLVYEDYQFESRPLPYKYVEVEGEEGRGFDAPVYTLDEGGKPTSVIESFQPDLEQRDLKSRFQILWHRLQAKAHAETNLATMVGLPEALKVRVITKSQPGRAFVLKTIQKIVHNKLRRHPTFQLIGTPVTSEILMKQVGPLQGVKEEYLSGDYEAATDNFYSLYSEICGKAIADCMELDYSMTRLLLESLTGFEIEYKEQIKKQTRGQLMGSVTSFPVLCLINAAMSRYAYERTYRMYVAMKDMPMLINGDDIGLRAVSEYYPIWESCTLFVGLKNSVGKTFRSRVMIQINSTFFFVLGEKNSFGIILNGDLKEVKFINFGLLKGLKRSGIGESMRDTSSARELPHARFKDLIESTPESLRETVADLFMDNNMDTLKSMKIPFHLPTWLGGAGIYYPGLARCQPSDLDLRIAGGIFWSNDPDEQVLDIGTVVPSWQIRRIAERRIPTPVIVEERTDKVREYDAYVGYKSIGLLFDSNIRLDDLFDVNSGEKSERRRNHALRINSKRYNPQHWEKKMTRPLPEKLLMKPGKFKSCGGESKINKNQYDTMVAIEEYRRGDNRFEDLGNHYVKSNEWGLEVEDDGDE